MNSNSEDSQDSKLNFHGIHFDLTDAMQLSMRDKFASLLRHNDQIVRINVRVRQDQTIGNSYHYTATGQIEIGGPDLVASAEGKDAYAVLDELSDKLDRQLERRHGRRKDKRNHPQETEIEAALPKVQTE
jgi:putative sigma-54 modulation protein